MPGPGRRNLVAMRRALWRPYSPRKTISENHPRNNLPKNHPARNHPTKKQLIPTAIHHIPFQQSSTSNHLRLQNNPKTICSSTTWSCKIASWSGSTCNRYPQSSLSLVITSETQGGALEIPPYIMAGRIITSERSTTTRSPITNLTSITTSRHTIDRTTHPLTTKLTASPSIIPKTTTTHASTATMTILPTTTLPISTPLTIQITSSPNSMTTNTLTPTVSPTKIYTKASSAITLLPKKNHKTNQPM